MTARAVVQTLLVGIVSVLLVLHAAGWLAAGVVFGPQASFALPPVQTAAALALSFAVLRAASAGRRRRRLIVSALLACTALAFVVVPLSPRYQGHTLMPGGVDTVRSRDLFEDRFPVGRGDVHFHSHLSDVVMVALDRAFGANDASMPRAFDAMSRLAGLLFLVELWVAAAWHRWSRQICRYVGLALATPLCLLFFGYWELGYLCVAVGVAPLLALARGRESVSAQASTLTAGLLQGLHTALHGFGMLGLAGGTLASLWGRSGVRGLVRALTFASAAVAMYLGWVFLYVTIGGLSLEWSRQLGSRPLFESVVFDKRIANPLLSAAGLGEFGLFSALAGVPVLALAVVTSSGPALASAILFALPSLLFLVRWWPVSAPYNLDLLLSVFPGLFAACWVLGASRRKAMAALVLFAVLHLVLWTTLGSGLSYRVWADGAP